MMRLFVTIPLVLITCLANNAEAGGKRKTQNCCSPNPACHQCQSSVQIWCNPCIPCGTHVYISEVDALTPITVQEESIETSEIEVEKIGPDGKPIIGPDGKPETELKEVRRVSTRLVQLDTANKQIAYLNEQLGKLRKEKADVGDLEKLEKEKVDAQKGIMDAIVDALKAANLLP